MKCKWSIYCGACAAAFFFSFSLHAEEESYLPAFAFSPAVRTMAGISAGGHEKRKSDSYEKRLDSTADFEYAFFPYLSAVTSIQYTDRKKTDVPNLHRAERLNAGMKLFTSGRYASGKTAFGIKAELFGKISSRPLEGETEDFYLFRLNAGTVRQAGSIIYGTFLQFQTETNDELQEKKKEEFRRHWKGGGFFSWKFAGRFRLNAETEYREPYNKKIDTDVRFWNFYPGISWNAEKQTAGFSLIVPVRKDGYADAGGRIYYAYYFR